MQPTPGWSKRARGFARTVCTPGAWNPAAHPSSFYANYLGAIPDSANIRACLCFPVPGTRRILGKLIAPKFVLFLFYYY
jgi:hypothetical protein